MNGFYGILDVGTITLGFMDMAAHAFADAGVQTVQLRGKELSTEALVQLAERLKPIISDAGARFIINDRADVAAVVGADGVHLGQTDLTAADARALLGQDALIGVSTHNEAEAAAAVDEGSADYITFGPVFETTTKPDAPAPVGLDRLQALCAAHATPVVGVGGISLDRCADVRQCGAAAVAMIGAVLVGDLQDNVRLAVEACG